MRLAAAVLYRFSAGASAVLAQRYGGDNSISATGRVAQLGDGLISESRHGLADIIKRMAVAISIGGTARSCDSQKKHGRMLRPALVELKKAAQQAAWSRMGQLTTAP